jgi:hypothetical protein
LHCAGYAVDRDVFRMGIQGPKHHNIRLGASTPPRERERERERDERETRERRERDERERERRETERERERERERETCFKYPYASVMCMLRVAHCVTALSSDAVHCIHLKRAGWRG